MSNNQPPPSRDLPWTPGLVEFGVLAVLPIVALGILVSGVVRIRDDDTRVRSFNRLKWIGLATHNINDTFWEVPLVSGPWKGDPNVAMGKPKHHTIFFNLLPFVGQDDLYKNILATGRSQDVSVMIYVNPKDPTGKGLAGECNYAANWQLFQQPLAPEVFDQQFSSIPRSMPDGMTTTVMFAEIYQNCNGVVRKWGHTGTAKDLSTPAFYRTDLPQQATLNRTDMFQLAPKRSACSPPAAQTPNALGMLICLGDSSVRAVDKTLRAYPVNPR